MKFDRAFLSTKFKASRLRDIKFNDNELLRNAEFNSARGIKFKTNEPLGAVFGAQGPAAERKILMRRKISAARGILKFKDASAR
ncbi:hypothetical protein [Campylobacter gracilis]|uniref:Uncharacterized protein n=1 Tax=Campylobacter gracilis RM3268 TaxID=553220 RepID=C8PJ56_9BACT|nr:hypothetical protein [Campylobacter gracilis]AKT92358.1 hypothetical protein CGRAC_0908 [Campylobacter gracilis]EEV16961.1 hypothetical protein CAMGR0001_1255 [Campylobacter gracilis RM3268]UEB45456.1 hypothetical protein LK410_10785 [Campylobacter gracilis]SUW81878.1 Uncharacterised protein [Campylobacter gracilis]